MTTTPDPSTPGAASAATGLLRRLGQELAKFGIVGIVGVAVQLASLTVLLDLMPGASVRANIIATLIAIGTNYIGYRYWVYRDTDKKTRAHEIMLFLVFSGIGLVIQNGVLFALTYGLDMRSKSVTLVFTIFGIGVATLFRFWAYRTWVFSGKPGSDGPAVTAVEQAEQILAAEQVKTSKRGIRSLRP
ncbi:GtrA family protein [Streptacidiphilus sp. EB129]|jgi:putative flippase GtrA|uniref:GtrA family protein n=1 Tax=Streptacidiphilus sp. EB129 TaxID=3156262 RepID=UPI003513C13B